MAKKIKVGLDFDGVVAYNPFRIVRAPVAFIKEKLLGVRELKFYVPQTGFQKFIWTIVHESSFFPAQGESLLKELARSDTYEFHLITARFHFLDKSLQRWLKRFGYGNVFSSINLNMHDHQPHIHKLEMIKQLDLDYYVEDNLDIVRFLENKTRTKIYWIYNITDREVRYPHKFPYLEKALCKIKDERKGK